MKTVREYLEDLLAHLILVENFTVEGYDAFVESEKTHFAVIRAYEVIGEIVKRIPKSVRDEHPELNWRELANFRDFLAHN